MVKLIEQNELINENGLRYRVESQGAVRQFGSNGWPDLTTPKARWSSLRMTAHPSAALVAPGIVYQLLDVDHA